MCDTIFTGRHFNRIAHPLKACSRGQSPVVLAGAQPLRKYRLLWYLIDAFCPEHPHEVAADFIKPLDHGIILCHIQNPAIRLVFPE